MQKFVLTVSKSVQICIIFILCSSPGLAQSNPPTNNKDVSKKIGKKEGRNILEFLNFKFSIRIRSFPRNAGTAILKKKKRIKTVETEKPRN